MANETQNQPGQPGQPQAAPGAPQPNWPPQPAPGAWPPAPGAWPPPPAQPGGWPPQQAGAWPPPPSQQGAWPPPPAQPQPGWGPPPGYPPQGYVPGPYAMGMPRYAGFWIRLVAWIIDGFILAVILIVLAITVVGILLWLPVGFGYMPVLWWRRGATFGQSALGMRVVRAVDGGPIDGGTAFVRALVMWGEQLLIYVFFIGLLGFVWAAFDPQKQAWHDKAANTVVVMVN
jgi:uncharacterized RDD family membrane protein YckC